MPRTYRRLFPPDDEAAAAATEPRLTALAGSMKGKNLWPGGGPEGIDKIPAAYTYFGQFIIHDLTREVIPKGQPDRPENQRSALLSLESLYGDGPDGETCRALYAADGASFIVPDSTESYQPFDVPLGADDRPLIAEAGNLENVIVRQVHALFLKLHNVAVAELSQRMPAKERFSKARQRVSHQFQWLVRHDFIRRLCCWEIYHRVLCEGERAFDWSEPFEVPVECARAVFRFGHSMVRNDYVLKGSQDRVPIGDLLARPDTQGSIPAEHAVNWANFLCVPGSNAEFAHRIDTSIIDPLFKLDVERAGAHALAIPVGLVDGIVLPRLTMERGVASRLPSGQAVQTGLKERTVPADVHLKACELQDHTPLWYYILLEAQVQEHGVRLGRVGSRLLAEVIEMALRRSEGSYLQEHGAGWRPEPWLLPDGRQRQIVNLYDVALVVGLA